MQIAKIENNEIVATGEHTQLFPNTSFPHEGPDDNFLVENNCVKMFSHIPHDPLTEQLQASPVYLKDGAVYTVVVQPKIEEIVVTSAEPEIVVQPSASPV